MTWQPRKNVLHAYFGIERFRPPTGAPFGMLVRHDGQIDQRVPQWEITHLAPGDSSPLMYLNIFQFETMSLM